MDLYMIHIYYLVYQTVYTLAICTAPFGTRCRSSKRGKNTTKRRRRKEVKNEKKGRWKIPNKRRERRKKRCGVENIYTYKSTGIKTKSIAETKAQVLLLFRIISLSPLSKGRQWNRDVSKRQKKMKRGLHHGPDTKGPNKTNVSWHKKNRRSNPKPPHQTGAVATWQTKRWLAFPAWLSFLQD